MDQDKAKQNERRTVILVTLVLGLVFLGVAFFIPYDSMVAQIIRQVTRGF
jgi:hypothetical protein